MKFDMWIFFENLWRKYKFHENLTRKAVVLPADLCTFYLQTYVHFTCRPIVHLRYYLGKFSSEWEMFQTKVVVKLKIHILCSINFFFRKFCLLWDKVLKYGRARQAPDENIIRRIRYSCWTTEATNTHCEYVILITFPWQHSSSFSSSIGATTLGGFWPALPFRSTVFYLYTSLSSFSLSSSLNPLPLGQAISVLVFLLVLMSMVPIVTFFLTILVVSILTTCAAHRNLCDFINLTKFFLLIRIPGNIGYANSRQCYVCTYIASRF